MSLTEWRKTADNIVCEGRILNRENGVKITLPDKKKYLMECLIGQSHWWMENLRFIGENIRLEWIYRRIGQWAEFMNN